LTRAKSKQNKDWNRFMDYLQEKNQHRYALFRVYDLMRELCCQDYENGEKTHTRRLIDGKTPSEIIKETVESELDGSWPLNNFEDFKSGFPYGFLLNR